MKLLKFLALVIAILLVGNIVLANSAVDESVTVKATSADIKALEQQNVSLKQNIAEHGALTNIIAHLEERGFVTSPKVVPHMSNTSVALR